jgi:glycosyltransferase involved in cell wall biosynthesis
VSNTISDLKILVVAEHASAKFGGEAVLPLHYYRVLRRRNIPVWLLVHERTRQELLTLYPEDQPHIRFVQDTKLQRFLWKVGTKLPDPIANYTVGFLMRFANQIVQRNIIKKMIKEVGINVVHQPMPVSPKEPSLLFGLGAPVIIGPMNGGMNYPPSFTRLRKPYETVSLALARSFSNSLNTILPGKLKASVLLVANERTRKALPSCLKRVKTELLVENGVDLSLWTGQVDSSDESIHREAVNFVYMGRLVDWKAIDILINSFANASKGVKMTLCIIGDGDLRNTLESQARSLGVWSESLEPGRIYFMGWKSQAECAEYLRGSDCLVLTSLMECGGAVVLEAMALGLPVIATDWGGPADYLDPSCGVLVKPTSRIEFTKGVSDALIKIASDAELRRMLGHSGREKVKSEFDWEIKVNKILDIYIREINEFYNIRNSH